ncbi:hypothetical protein BGZ76_004723, partial [Entomortierella beljakovae]
PISLKPTYSILDVDTQKEIQHGTPYKSRSREEAPSPTFMIDCYDAKISGPQYSLTCNAREWYEWVDCSDGSRYTTPKLSGRFRAVISCPSGTNAIRGGAYGN